MGHAGTVAVAPRESRGDAADGSTLDGAVRRAVALARYHRWHQAEAELRAGLARLPRETLTEAYLGAVATACRVAATPEPPPPLPLLGPTPDAGHTSRDASCRSTVPPVDPSQDYAHAILTALRRCLSAGGGATRVGPAG